MKLLEYRPMKQLEYRPMLACENGAVVLRLSDFNRMLTDAIRRRDPNVGLLIAGFKFSDTKAILQEVGHDESSKD
jgi:hypothetical protein